MGGPLEISVSKTLDDLAQAWNRRLRSPVAEYIIIWLSAYSTEPIYPYSLHAHLVELWNEEEAPALQSIYSAIKRLEADDLLDSRQEIVDGRVQKILLATERGFDLLDMMTESFSELLVSLEHYMMRK